MQTANPPIAVPPTCELLNFDQWHGQCVIEPSDLTVRKQKTENLLTSPSKNRKHSLFLVSASIWNHLAFLQFPHCIHSHWSWLQSLGMPSNRQPIPQLLDVFFPIIRLIQTTKLTTKWQILAGNDQYNDKAFALVSVDVGWGGGLLGAKCP